jgi:hypothetical protein
MRRGICRFCRMGQSLDRIRERRDYADAAKTASGCVDCPAGSQWPPVALDFDHRPGLAKLATVAALISKGSWEEFVAEIEKYEVVCANHHRIRTAERVRVAPPGRAIPRRHRRGLAS